GLYKRYEPANDQLTVKGTNKTFTTPNITGPHTYRVEATNDCGTATSQYVTVTPADCDPAQITQQPVGGHVAPGGTFQMSVVAQGTATLTYQWFKATT